MAGVPVETCDSNLDHNEAQQQSFSGVDRYRNLGKINAGAYGVVYRALDRNTGEIVAIKHETEGLSESALMEIKILAALPRHPSIVGFKEVLVDARRSVFVVMEHMEGDLEELIEAETKPFTLSEVKLMMKKILLGVMHRDLKPANILINHPKGELRICDFGLSRLGTAESGSYTAGIGTQWYKAPELLLLGTYSCAVDMWAVGCIMAELVLREVLFPADSEFQQMRSIFHTLGLSSYPVRLRVDTAAAYGRAPLLTAAGMDLLERLLAFLPNNRITAADALNHPWFREFYGLSV